MAVMILSQSSHNCQPLLYFLYLSWFFASFSRLVKSYLYHFFISLVNRALKAESSLDLELKANISGFEDVYLEFSDLYDILPRLMRS